jgi:hypothetical protein
MKQAVKALETDPCKENAINNAQFFIKQAIAEAEKQEPVAWIVDGEIKVRLDMAGKLYYSETNVYAAPVHAIDIPQECVDETAKHKHELVGQPDLAKVGEVGVWGDKREWVGLEEEEILRCFDSVALGQVEGDCVIDKHVNIFNAIRAVEAKLKEKNT